MALKSGQMLTGGSQSEPSLTDDPVTVLIQGFLKFGHQQQRSQEM